MGEGIREGGRDSAGMSGRGMKGWGGRFPNRLYGEVGMDSRLRGENGWGEGIREGDEIPRE